MSDTIDQETTPKAPSELHPKIEEMLARIDEGGDRADAVQAFARALLRRLADDDLAEFTSDELFALATSAFAFADGRGRRPRPSASSTPTRHPGLPLSRHGDRSDDRRLAVPRRLGVRGAHRRGASRSKRLLHPVIGAVRDDEGRLVRVVPGREADARESFMHFEVDRSLSDDVNAELQERVRRMLADVAAVVRDFDAMQERVRHMIELARAAEVATRRR